MIKRIISMKVCGGTGDSNLIPLPLHPICELRINLDSKKREHKYFFIWPKYRFIWTYLVQVLKQIGTYVQYLSVSLK